MCILNCKVIFHLIFRTGEHELINSSILDISSHDLNIANYIDDYFDRRLNIQKKIKVHTIMAIAVSDSQFGNRRPNATHIKPPWLLSQRSSKAFIIFVVSYAVFAVGAMQSK